MKFNNQSLKKAVKEWFSDKQKAKKTYGDISEWDTSEVTDMSELFKGIEQINEDLSKWNTGSVTDMSGIFKSAKIQYANIANWNVTKVSDMTEAFHSCDFGYKEPHLNWKIENNVNTHYMFYEASRYYLKHVKREYNLRFYENGIEKEYGIEKGSIECHEHYLSHEREFVPWCDNDHYGFESYLDDYWEEDVDDSDDLIDYFTATSESNILIEGPDIGDDDLDNIFGEGKWGLYFNGRITGDGYRYDYKWILQYWEKLKKELKPFENLKNLENLKPGEIFWRD